jgi:hypothetical protein
VSPDDLLAFIRVAARVELQRDREVNSRRKFLELLGLPPSPVVAAILDASQGIRPTTITNQQAIETFGCGLDEMAAAYDRWPGGMPRVVVVRAGGRGGKTSRMLAPMAIQAALSVPLPTLESGEHAWSLIVAPDKTLAAQALSFVRGYIERVPWLRNRVVNRSFVGGVERFGNSECITLKRDDGKLVDIRIGVASSGGKWARGKTFVFVGFDEAAFFQADTDKVANDRDLFQAAIQRIVPGGQLWMVSTPWIEGFGVMEEKIAEDWGRHEHSLIASGPTRALNPKWDPDHTIETHMRLTDPDNAAREIDAIPLPAGSKVFFSPELLRAAIEERDVDSDGRPFDLPWIPLLTHYGAADLGFRKNSSALGIARREEGRMVLAFRREIRPARGEPLRPSAVCRSFAEDCAEYRAFTVLGDLHYADTAHEEFQKVRQADPVDQTKMRAIQYLDFDPSIEAVSDAFSSVRDAMANGRARIPNDVRLVSQLRMTTTKPTPGGALRIVLPRVGNSHGDLAFASILAMSRVSLSEDVPRIVERGARAKLPRIGSIRSGGGF